MVRERKRKKLRRPREKPFRIPIIGWIIVEQGDKCQLAAVKLEEIARLFTIFESFYYRISHL